MADDLQPRVLGAMRAVLPSPRRWPGMLLRMGLLLAGPLGLAGHAAAGPGLGRLLITLPDSELLQVASLDNLEPLSAHTDRNAKDARFYAGNQHYFKIQNIGFKQDAFAVYSSATGQVEYQAKSIPRVSDAQPAPGAAGVFSFVFLDTTGDTGLFAVVDLAQEQRVLASDKGEVGKYLYWWMPDGSIRRLHASTGELSAWRGKLQSANQRIEWQVIGAMPPPLPDVIFGAASLSPSGDELLLSTVEARSHRVDLWMADVRSGALQRITADGFVSFVTWAPDGRHFLLQRNNVSFINTSFRGQCSYWVAPAGARHVAGIVPGVPHPVVKQVFYGSPQERASLPCGKVAAWIR